METLAVTRTYGGIQTAVENALELLELSLEPNIPIVIKPNLCCIKGPETGATTDVQVVEALVNSIRMHYRVKEFYLVESDATSLNADLAFQLLGYNKLARKLNVNILNLTKIPHFCQKFPKNLNLNLMRIPKIFKKKHFLISVAKMKTHTLCKFTATLKNMYGCNPEPYKAKYHNKLNENIVDFVSAFRPDLAVIDAITPMEGSGPTNGTPLKLNTLLFGRDPLAIDYLSAKIMGLNPGKVKYLELAQKQRLGSTKFKTKGADPHEIKRKFKEKPKILGIYSKIFH